MRLWNSIIGIMDAWWDTSFPLVSHTVMLSAELLLLAVRLLDIWTMDGRLK